MGACATKPAIAEGDAPKPLEEPASDPKADGSGEREGAETAEANSAAEGGGPADENRRKSLGVLFKENQESSESSEIDKNILKETVAQPLVEVKEMVQYSKTEQQPSEEIQTIVADADKIDQKEAVQPSSEDHCPEESKPRNLIADENSLKDEISTKTEEHPSEEVKLIAAVNDKNISVDAEQSKTESSFEEAKPETAVDHKNVAEEVMQSKIQHPTEEAKLTTVVDDKNISEEAEQPKTEHPIEEAKREITLDDSKEEVQPMTNEHPPESEERSMLGGKEVTETTTDPETEQHSTLEAKPEAEGGDEKLLKGTTQPETREQPTQESLPKAESIPKTMVGDEHVQEETITPPPEEAVQPGTEVTEPPLPADSKPETVADETLKDTIEGDPIPCEIVESEVTIKDENQVVSEPKEVEISKPKEVETVREAVVDSSIGVMQEGPAVPENEHDT